MKLIDVIRKTNLGALAALALLLCGAGTQLAACNTTSGVGRDVEAAGRGLHNAAEDAKN